MRITAGKWEENNFVFLKFYSVEHNSMFFKLEHDSVLFSKCPLVVIFSQIIIDRNLEQVEPFTQTPCPQVFTQRRHSRTLHTIFTSDGKLNATGCCSELSLPFTCIQFIFGSPMAFNVDKSAALFLFCKTKTVCSTRCVIRKFTLLPLPQ